MVSQPSAKRFIAVEGDIISLNESVDCLVKENTSLKEELHYVLGENVSLKQRVVGLEAENISIRCILGDIQSKLSSFVPN